MTDETSMSIQDSGNQTNAADGKTDLLCADCGEAFSSFLQEMADHNAKVTACPKCGKHHEFKPTKPVKSSHAKRSVKKLV